MPPAVHQRMKSFFWWEVPTLMEEIIRIRDPNFWQKLRRGLPYDHLIKLPKPLSPHSPNCTRSYWFFSHRTPLDCKMKQLVRFTRCGNIRTCRAPICPRLLRRAVALTSETPPGSRTPAAARIGGGSESRGEEGTRNGALSSLNEGLMGPESDGLSMWAEIRARFMFFLWQCILWSLNL